MPKSSPLQADFSSGELGPLVDGRLDAEKHKTGLDTCLNYIPTLEGPLIRRPGTKRVGSVKDPSQPPVFIPFRFSDAEQYMIEAGDRYFRFFTNNGQIITSGTSYAVAGCFAPMKDYNQFIPSFETAFFGSRSNNRAKKSEVGWMTVFSSIVSGSILEVRTPYDINMVKNLSWAQKGDTLWLMNSSIPTFTLQRITSTEWELKQFITKDGPYLDLNTQKTIGDSTHTQFKITRQQSALQTTLQKDAIFIKTHSSVLIATAISNAGNIEIRTVQPHGRLTGDRVWIAGITGTTEANNGSSNTNPARSDSSVWTVQVLSGTSILLVGSVFANAYTGGTGTVWPAVFRPEDRGRNIALYINSQRYFGAISQGSSMTSSIGTGATGWPHIDWSGHPIQEVMVEDLDSMEVPVGTTIVNIWQMGAHCREFGYPSAGCFHQSRLVFAGTQGVPTQFNASKIGAHNTFSLSDASSLTVLDASAMQFNLVSDSADRLKWVRSGPHGLYFLSESAEFIVTPSREGQALTPTNISNEIIGYYGAGDVMPARSGDAIIYVQNSGRKVRELQFFANLQAHKSTNITQLSDHIGFPDIKKLSVQKEFYPIVWAHKSDGKLISMSYSREESQVQVGWARHELGGASDSGGTSPKVVASDVMRDPTGRYDQVWMAVQRFINGTSDVVVEYMTEAFRERDLTQKQRDAFYIDCGATYDSSVVISSITTGSALVTAANHGFVRNDLVLISDVLGMNSSVVNINSYAVNSNVVNEIVFVVGSTTTNTFFLQTFNSSIVSTTGFSPYVSGGKARKLVSSIGGLTWLKNESVDVLADGGVHGKAIVNSAGVLTLTYPAAVVQIGYGFKSQIKTLIKESGSATGSSMGARKKPYQLSFNLRSVGDLSWGPDFSNMSRADFGEGDFQSASAAIPLFTGVYRDGVEHDVDFYGQVCIEQSAPLPGMIKSITTHMDEYDL